MRLNPPNHNPVVLSRVGTGGSLGLANSASTDVHIRFCFPHKWNPWFFIASSLFFHVTNIFLNASWVPSSGRRCTFRGDPASAPADLLPELQRLPPVSSCEYSRIYLIIFLLLDFLFPFCCLLLHTGLPLCESAE